MTINRADLTPQRWSQPHTWNPSRAVAVTLLALTITAAGLWIGLSRLLTTQWPWERADPVPAQTDVLKLALAVVAGGGAAVALVVAYRRQRTLEHDAAGRRDQTRLLTERFGAAAAQLGGEHAAVRLAGVYSMAAVADEWEEQRQQCIDVLCGYLRLPYAGDPPPGHPTSVVEERVSEYVSHQQRRTETTLFRPGEVEVRKATVDTITRHLQDDAPIRWSHLDYDLANAHLIDASFRGATFSGKTTTFDKATFSGKNTSFDRATFSGKNTIFRGATFSGENTWFDGATFSGENTTFMEATFSGENTEFDGATFSGENTWFTRATFSGENTTFDGATFSGENTTFMEATFSGENTTFMGATFSGENTTFMEATFSGENTRFSKATFSSKSTKFDEATFVRLRDQVDQVDAAISDVQFTNWQGVHWGPIPPRCAWPGEADGPSVQGRSHRQDR